MYLFVNSEDGDELSNALTDRRRMRVKPGVEPSNMRILLADILTFDGSSSISVATKADLIR